MKVLVTGLNHRTAALELRERVAFSAAAASQAMRELRAADVLREVAIVSTCNRSEIYGVAPRAQESASHIKQFFAAFHGVEAGALDSSLYTWFGAEAVRHLFRVSAGLDSQLLGEAEILGQVREAFRQARGQGTAGPALDRLFQDALAVGKRVRAETEIGVHPTSVASAAVKLVEKIYARVTDRTVLILGAGAMAEQMVEYLVSWPVAHVLVANRSPERAAELAARFGGQAVRWDELESALTGADIVIGSTAAETFVLGPAQVERAMAARNNQPLFFVDISVPRNIDPRVEAIYNVYLYNLEHFQHIVEENKREREKEIPRAERLVADQVEKFLCWQDGRALDTLVAALQRKLASATEEQIARQVGGRLLRLPEADRSRTEILTRALISEIRAPVAPHLKQLRALVAQLGHVEAVRALFTLDEETG